MNESLRKISSAGLSTLSDINKFSDSKMTPLILQAEFYMAEVRRVAEIEINNNSTFSSISNYLEKTVDKILEKYLLSNITGHQVLIQRCYGNFSLETWNRLLDVLPSCLEVVKLFRFVETQKIQISKEEIHFKGLIISDIELKKYKRLIHAYTKKMVSKKVLLTYSIDECQDSRTCLIDLKLDLSYQKEDFFVFPFEYKNINLCFSSIVGDYVSTFSEVSNAGRHLVVEITDDLQVNKYYRLPDHFASEQMSKTFLHFAFLFRPISLIIPKEGEFISRSGLLLLKDTGRVASGKQQDVKLLDHFIDFFSLLEN